MPYHVALCDAAASPSPARRLRSCSTTARCRSTQFRWASLACCACLCSEPLCPTFPMILADLVPSCFIGRGSHSQRPALPARVGERFCREGLKRTTPMLISAAFVQTFECVNAGLTAVEVEVMVRATPCDLCDWFQSSLVFLLRSADCRDQAAASGADQCQPQRESGIHFRFRCALAFLLGAHGVFVTSSLQIASTGKDGLVALARLMTTASPLEEIVLGDCKLGMPR